MDIYAYTQTEELRPTSCLFYFISSVLRTFWLPTLQVNWLFFEFGGCFLAE